MAEHTVKVKLPKRVEVLGKDLEVSVARNGRRIGTLKISKGSLDWRGAYDQFSHVLYWERFAELALERGVRRRRR